MNRTVLLIIVGLVLFSIIALGVNVYQVSRPTEPDVTYHLPKRTQQPKIEAKVVKPKPPPVPSVRKPEPKLIDTSDDDHQFDTDTVFDPELDEFLSLLTEVAEIESEDDKPKELLELTPDEMIEHLKENYHPDNYMDFLSSGTGLVWARKVLAPGIPRLDDPFVTACKDMYPRRGDDYSTCIEDRYKELVAKNPNAYVNGYNNIMNFIDKLQPSPLGGGGARSSILPPVPLGNG